MYPQQVREANLLGGGMDTQLELAVNYVCLITPMASSSRSHPALAAFTLVRTCVSCLHHLFNHNVLRLLKIYMAIPFHFDKSDCVYTSSLYVTF